MKMFLSIMIFGFVPYLVMLGYGVNIFVAGAISAILMTIVASIITKIDFGSWNPF